MFPDFLGIGAQKAGTTWLHRNLQIHPQIWMPRKEVHYFDRKINDRSNAVTRLFGRRQADEQWRRQVKHWGRVHLVQKPSLRDLLWDVKYYMRPYNDKWYASVFEPKKGRVTGEITPAYSALSREKVAHIHRIMPETKLIFFIRNPIERVWSQTVMSFDKVEKGSVRAASEEELFQRVERDSAWLLTGYLRTLENWGAFYPEEQIFVGFLEDVHFAPQELLGRLYEFLGVDSYFDPSLTNKKVHSRSAGTMPTKVAVQLARNYYEEITRLHERFGGYASYWLYCADRLINDPPKEESIPYPLYESSVWEEWAGSSSDGSPEASSRQVQSGPLTSVQVAR